MNENKKLEEKRNDLVEQAEAVLAKAKAETRELSDEELKTIDDLKAQVDRIDKTIQANKDVAHLGEKKKPEEGDKDKEEQPVNEDEKKRQQEAADERGFDNYIRGIVVETRADGDPPAATELTKGANGAVIPTSIVKRILKRVYDISPILQKAQRFNVKGTLQLPYYDTETDTITVAYQSEFGSLSSHVGKMSSISLTGFLAGALALVSMSLINNSDFDLVTFVVNEMADSIKRWLEGEAIHGTQNKIDGLSTLTNMVTAAATGKVTMDELIDVQEAVSDDFQSDAIWIMNKKTRTAIRKLKNDVGEYLLQKDSNAKWGYTLLGKPVYTTDSMDQMGAGKNAIYYGDFSGLVVKISEDANIQVLREKYADQHAVGVIGWIEADCKVQNEQKLSGLKMAAA